VKNSFCHVLERGEEELSDFWQQHTFETKKRKEGKKRKVRLLGYSGGGGVGKEKGTELWELSRKKIDNLRSGGKKIKGFPPDPPCKRYIPAFLTGKKGIKGRGKPNMSLAGEEGGRKRLRHSAPFAHTGKKKRQDTVINNWYQIKKSTPTISPKIAEKEKRGNV